MRWSRPSLAGRRVALERKWWANVEQYGGHVKLLTVTPPGEDLLPFGDESRVVDGDEVALVEGIYRTLWNATAQARMSRLMEAAQRAADRWVRKSWKGPLPRQVGNVRAEQKRGVWHFHYLLPYESEIERVWSKTVERYLDRAWKRERERWPDERDRRLMVEREYLLGETVRGFYGFGFVHGGKPQGKDRAKASKYMARNAAGYMAGNVAGVGRHYVSSRLTRETGVTMKALRACNWLYVRRLLIAAGELDDDETPFYWSDEWRAEVLRVYALVTGPRGSPDEIVPAASPSH